MKARNVAFALAGAGVLVLKGHYSGPGELLVHSYAGNVGASFALYFAAISATQPVMRQRFAAAAAVLLVVSAFELTDGFGFMTNVQDYSDLVANAVGVGLAVLVDLASARLMDAGASRRPAVT